MQWLRVIDRCWDALLFKFLLHALTFIHFDNVEMIDMDSIGRC